MADDISFVYIKATQRDDFIDPQFAANWAGAEAAGIDRGAYHFFSLWADGEIQAAHFLSVAPVREAELPIAVDLELIDNCNQRPMEEWVLEEVGRFLAVVKADEGRPAMLYIGPEFAEHYPGVGRLDRSLWVRSYLRRPATEGWAVWQVGGYAHVEGVEGRADLDVLR